MFVIKGLNVEDINNDRYDKHSIRVMENKKGGEVLTRPLIKQRLTRQGYVRRSLLSVASYPTLHYKVTHFF